MVFEIIIGDNPWEDTFNPGASADVSEFCWWVQNKTKAKFRQTNHDRRVLESVKNAYNTTRESTTF